MSKQKIFDEAGYLARRARNEARLTDAGVYGPHMAVSYTHLTLPTTSRV